MVHAFTSTKGSRKRKYDNRYFNEMIEGLIILETLHNLCMLLITITIFNFSCVGKSTHNQRIERLWRDVFAGCTILFYNLFYELERSGMLNPVEDIHLWCLHYTFLPVINRHLTNWKNAWIHHPLRSERNSTPMQLWIRGLNGIWGSESTIDREIFQVNFFLRFLIPFLGSYNVKK